LGFGSGTNKIDDGSEVQETSIGSTSIGIVPGFNFFFSEKVAFEMTWGFLGWRQTTTEQEVNSETVKNTSNTTGLSFNSKSLSIGFCYFLN